MFHKARFKCCDYGVGVCPINVGGWLQTLAHLAVVFLPALLLLAVRGVPEAAIWAGVAGAVCLHHARRLAGQLKRDNNPEVFVIDEQTDVTNLARSPRLR